MFEYSRIQNVITAAIYVLMAVLMYRDIKKGKEENYIKYLLGFVALCVFAFYGDYWHYAEHIYNLSMGGDSYVLLEQVYKDLAEIVRYNYSLWRLVVWGSGIFAMSQALKKMGTNNTISLFVVFVNYFWLFAYARNAVAVVIFSTGLILFYANTKKFERFVGIALIVGSFFLHKSMVVAIASTAFFFMKFNRKEFIISLLLLPIVVRAISVISQTPELMFAISSPKSDYYDMDLIQEKFANSFDYKTDRGGGVFSALFSTIKDLAKYSLFVLLIFRMSFQGKISQLPSLAKKMYSIMYVLLYIGVAFALAGFGDSTLSYRIINMSFALAVFIMVYLLKEQQLSWKDVKLVTMFALIANMLKELFYVWYCVIVNE